MAAGFWTDQDDRPIPCATAWLTRPANVVGVAGGVLDGDAIRRARSFPRARSGSPLSGPSVAAKSSSTHVVAQPVEDARLMVEGLLVAEKHRLVAHLQLALVRAHGDQPDGRRGGGIQLGLGFAPRRTGRPRAPPGARPVSWQRPGRWESHTLCSSSWASSLYIASPLSPMLRAPFAYGTSSKYESITPAPLD